MFKLIAEDKMWNQNNSTRWILNLENPSFKKHPLKIANLLERENAKQVKTLKQAQNENLKAQAL